MSTFLVDVGRESEAGSVAYAVTNPSPEALKGIVVPQNENGKRT